MTQENKPYVRQRLNVSQTSKGLHQVEVTVETLSSNGEQPSAIADGVLKLIEETENRLRQTHRKLVIDSDG